MTSIWDRQAQSPSSPKRPSVTSFVKRSFVAKVMFDLLDEQEAEASCTVAITATGVVSLFDGLEEQLRLVAGFHHGGPITHLKLTESAPSRLVPSKADATRWTQLDRPEIEDSEHAGLLLLLPVSFICYPTWTPRPVSFSIFLVGVGPRFLAVKDPRQHIPSGPLQRRGRCDSCNSPASLKAAIEAVVHQRISTSRLSFANSAPVHDLLLVGGTFQPFVHVAQLASYCCLLCDMSHRRQEDVSSSALPLEVGGVLDALQLRRQLASTPTLPLDNRSLFINESHVTTESIDDQHPSNRFLFGSIASAARSPIREASGRVSLSALETRLDPTTSVGPFRFEVSHSLQTPPAHAAPGVDRGLVASFDDYGRDHRSESPQRIQNDLVRDMRTELTARFPVDARTMRARQIPPTITQAIPEAQPLTPRTQRKALIHLAMQELMHHRKRDFFTTATLVGITTNIVAEFSRRYEPQGAMIRLPLGKYDQELLKQICEDCMRAEVVRGTTPFPLHAGGGGRTVKPSFDEVSPRHFDGDQLEEGFVPDAPPMASGSRAPPPPSSSILVLTKPQLDTHRKRLLAYATVGVDIFDNSVAALATKSKQPGKVYPKGSGTELPFRWFLRTGPSQMIASSREISLEALFGLGVAESYILSYTVPITVALELDLDPNRDFHEVEHHEKMLVHRYRAGGSVSQPLQEGAQYTIGIEICRRDVPINQRLVTALQTFVIPPNSGVAPLTKDELRDVLNPRLVLARR